MSIQFRPKALASAALLYAAWFLPVAYADGNVSDEALTKALVGAWTYSPKDGRYQAFQSRGMYTYAQVNADGTSVVYFYRGRCGQLLAQVKYQWKIASGIRTETYVNNGREQTFTSRITVTSPNSFEATPLDGTGKLYFDRTEPCAVS